MCSSVTLPSAWNSSSRSGSSCRAAAWELRAAPRPPATAISVRRSRRVTSIVGSRSGKLDVGRALVRAAVRIQEGDLHDPGLGGLEGEREDGVLADGLGRLGLDDLL